MKIKFGPAKHFSNVTLEDHQRHMIWTSAHDSRHDEQWEKPIVSVSEVTEEIVKSPLIVPIITVCAEGTQLFGTAWYSHQEKCIFAVSIWHEGRWKDPFADKILVPPVTFVSVPKLLGEANVRFLWKDESSYQATRY